MEPIDQDEEYFGDLKNSQLLKTARKKPLKDEVNFYDKNVIEQSMNKSYIFKMAQNGRKLHQKHKIFQQNQNQAMTRSKIIKKFTKKFDSQRQFVKLSKIIFQVKNVGKKGNFSLNCCQNFSFQGDKSTVKFVGEKQIQIYDQSATKMKYSLNFDTVRAKIIDDDMPPNSYGFLLKFNKKLVLYFECHQDYEAINKLRGIIKTMIEKSDGLTYKLTNLLKQNPPFYQKRYKTAVQFAESCKTGDILLFQGSHFFGNVQRLFTNSDFDHVGMVIRNSRYGLLIFESNSTSGVCLTPWEYLVKYQWYQTIERIVWRKLENVKRDNDFELLIDQFVEANLGKNYFISIDKLVSNQSYIAKKNEQVGFFCSQLVAKLYKDLGLLTRNKKNQQFKPSCNFYPYHFSEKFPLKLLEGAISKQYQVYFNKEALRKLYQLQ